MASIERAFLKTPIGYLEVTCSEKGVQTLTFLDFRVRSHKTPHRLVEPVRQLKDYFSGNLKTFDLPIDLTGSEFQMSVWKEVMKIPFGETITYHELARRIGNPDAFRAVGGANGKNPLSVIIPCHRVIGADNRLTGYAFGLWRKKWLLEHESAFLQKDLFYK